MSEYQYYDFKAIDHALTKTEMAALRAISTRAVITTTSFTNHYEWGDLKGHSAQRIAAHSARKTHSRRDSGCEYLHPPE